TLAAFWLFCACCFAVAVHPLPAPAQDKKIPVTGLADADLAPFDDMMLKFMRDYDVPGAALAVAKDGKLVYARGFGHADNQLGLPVQPGMRFRIASISKPITAAMILRLIELGLLKLDDNPFVILKIALPDNADPRLKKITIRQLMHHTAGFDRGKSFDPMFRPIVIAKDQNVKPPAKPIDIIHYMNKQKLDFDPGTRYAYSNYGYCILGRVIEKVTKQSYEAAVQKHLFDPIGVKNTQLGHTLTTAKNEVRYYDANKREANAVLGPNLGKPVPVPYGAWYLEAMDAHGGWISSAPDLVRFGSAFDQPEKCKILKADSIKTMFTAPDLGAVKESSVGYGCGWQVRKLGRGNINTWHTDSLDGTETILVRRHDGLCWAVLFNTRKGLTAKIDPLVHQAADKVKRWPERNLFDQ
ncbi:MAG: beta-lactamase family protein, partial [Planctomycetes bacterium]|nr:beta-lactamase family protein [Planctomycetota bacterium]